MPFPQDVIAEAVFTGRVAQRWPGRPPSSIGKQPVEGRLWLTKTGLRGDEQADLTAHGGLEKAVHHFAADRYAYWRDQMPDVAAKFRPGGFGENISSSGLTEDDLCIGDIIRLGGAIVQITQGRQPCWKLSLHIGREDMAMRFQKSGWTGWYYRVLQEGFVEAGDPVELEERPQPGFPLPMVFAARFDPALDPAIARALSQLPELSESWRKGFARKSDPSYVEDTAPRLAGS
jgi:MOSC domain-containing protein YiiM